MHVVSRERLKQAAAKHADLAEPLEVWFRIAKRAVWNNLQDFRKTYSHADPVGRCTVFNIKGNSYRLIVKIEYRWRRIFVRRVLTHAEYGKGDWKDDCNAD